VTHLLGLLPRDAVLLVLGLAAAGATLAGGALALRYAARVHLILGFSAGAVIGVALLDLLPEALDLAPAGRTALSVTGMAALGFLIYLAADRALLMLARGDAGHRGHFGAGSLTVHSLLDGLAIGLGFQASAAVGAALAVAVLAHDLADGVNTVNLSLTGSASARIARRWLIADALAPLVGIALSRFIVLPTGALGAVIAVFSGFFLYIGASELLPESHHRHPRAWTTLSTIAGVGLIWLVVRLG
jgi:ZIP family zinc transporter